MSTPTGYGDPDDILRSVRRYVAQMLGSPPWTVRLQRTRVTDDERPAAVLDPGIITTPVSRAGMRDGNMGDQQKMQPITVVCYPGIGDTAAISAETARQLASLLDAGFSRGLVTTDTPPVNIGAPWRVPIYYFAETPITGAERAGPDEPYMYANVDSSFSVRPVQDPLDELRYTVVASLRLTWWQGARVLPSSPTVAGMAGGWSASVP